MYAVVDRVVLYKNIADIPYQRDALTSYICIEDLKNISSVSMKILPATSVLLCSNGLYNMLGYQCCS